MCTCTYLSSMGRFVLCLCGNVAIHNTVHTFSLIGREVGWCSMFLMFRCFDVLIGSFIQIRVNAKKDLRPSLLPPYSMILYYLWFCLKLTRSVPSFQYAQTVYWLHTVQVTRRLTTIVSITRVCHPSY